MSCQRDLTVPAGRCSSGAVGPVWPSLPSNKLVQSWPPNGSRRAGPDQAARLAMRMELQHLGLAGARAHTHTVPYVVCRNGPLGVHALACSSSRACVLLLAPWLAPERRVLPDDGAGLAGVPSYACSCAPVRPARQGSGAQAPGAASGGALACQRALARVAPTRPAAVCAQRNAAGR